MRLDHLLSRVKPTKRKVIEDTSSEISRVKQVRHYIVLRVHSVPSEQSGMGKSGNRGDVAQLGERLPCTQEAIGSNPFISTTVGS